MPTVNSSSSPPAEDRLIRVPLERLHPHPKNPNHMPPEERAKLGRNIVEQGGWAPPLVVRPQPGVPADYEILDGEQRWAVLGELGYPDAPCVVWDCDDVTAARALLTLNRLRGEDIPARRAALIADLTAFMPKADLAFLLPEDAGEIDALLALLDLDTDRLLADLTAASERVGQGLRSISFAVTPEQEQIVERAIALAMEPLSGKHRRGQALTVLAQRFIESEQ